MNRDELREQVAIEERDSLATLALIQDLRTKINDRIPTVHEIAAFGTYVHGLYCGAHEI